MATTKRERQEEFLFLYPQCGYSITRTIRKMSPPLHRNQVYRWKSEKGFKEKLAALDMEQADIAKDQMWRWFIVPTKVKEDKDGNPEIDPETGEEKRIPAKPNLTALIFWMNMTGDFVGFDLEKVLKQEELQRKNKERTKKKGRRIVRPSDVKAVKKEKS